MTTLAGLLIAFVGCAAVLGGVFFARWCAFMAREYGDATEAFFKAASPIVQDGEVPEELLQVVATLNDSLTDRRCARKLLVYLASGRWKARSSTPSALLNIRSEFFHRRPELEAPFHEMAVQWFSAVTALSPLSGVLARSFMAEPEVEGAAVRTTARRRNNIDDRSKRARVAAGPA